MPKNSELKEALFKVKNEMKEQIELIHIRAQLCREYYVELINDGFTKEEALELCKTFTL